MYLSSMSSSLPEDVPVRYTGQFQGLEKIQYICVMPFTMTALIPDSWKALLEFEAIFQFCLVAGLASEAVG